MYDYGWKITHDHTDGHDNGTTGPSHLSAKRSSELEDVLDTLHRFRMYDDDGALCYEGLFAGDAGSEDGFGPLDDFGAPNVGCTGIKYLDKTTGHWEWL